jgi:hypothetical protein
MALSRLRPGFESRRRNFLFAVLICSAQRPAIWFTTSVYQKQIVCRIEDVFGMPLWGITLMYIS